MTDILHINNLSHRYPQSDHPTLQNLSFALKEGEITCLLGTNGCGKSTLLKILAGELLTYTGQIQQNNLKIAYISQDLNQILFSQLTLEENLILLHISFPSLKAKKAYFDDYHPKLFKHLNNLLSTLSGGEKQAFALAVTLYSCPDILLLDEHTSALDPESEKRLMDITYRKITAHKITTLMCTHKVDLVQRYAQRIIGLNKGKIVVDIAPVRQTLSQESLQKIYF